MPSSNVKQISSLIDNIKPYLIDCGFKMSGIAFDSRRLEKQNDADYAFKWLNGFLFGICPLLNKAKTKQQTVEARRQVRAEWHRRPNSLKRTAIKANNGKQLPSKKLF